MFSLISFFLFILGKNTNNYRFGINFVHTYRTQCVYHSKPHTRIARNSYENSFQSDTFSDLQNDAGFDEFIRRACQNV